MFKHRRNAFLHAAAALVLLIQISCIWLITYLPLQDYYEWLIQSKILLNLWSGDEFIHHYNFYSFSPVPPPNTLLNVFMAALQLIVSTETSGKIVLTLYVLFFNLGVYQYCQKNMDEHPLRFMGLLFTFNLFFYAGFLSFIIGVSLFILMVPVFSTNNSPTKKKALQILAASLVLYLVHGFAFGLFMLAFMVWLLRLNWNSTRKHKLLIPIIAILPSVILSVIYVANLPTSRETSLGWHESIFHQLQNVRYGFTYFQRIALMDNVLPLTFLNLFILFFAGLIFIKFRKHISIKSFSGVLAVICILIMIFNPVYRIGDFYPISSRFSIIIIPLLCGAFVFSRSKPNLEAVIVASALFVSLGHAAQFWNYDQQAGPTISELKPHYHTARSPFLISRVNIDDFEKSPLHIFSGIVKPYIFTENILNTDSLRFFIPIHATGIVRMRRNEETTVKTFTDSLFDGLKTRQYFIDTAKEFKDTLATHYDKIFVVGSQTTQNAIVAALQPEFVQTKKLDLWVVMERNQNKIIRRSKSFCKTVRKMRDSIPSH